MGFLDVQKLNESESGQMVWEKVKQHAMIIIMNMNSSIPSMTMMMMSRANKSIVVWRRGSLRVTVIGGTSATRHLDNKSYKWIYTRWGVWLGIQIDQLKLNLTIKVTLNKINNKVILNWKLNWEIKVIHGLRDWVG